MSPARIENPPADADVSPVTPPPGQPAADTTLSEAWMTIRKRKWIILAFVVFGLIYGFYQANTQPRLFEASGTIEIRSGSSNEFRVSASTGATEGNSRMPTQVAILKSDSLLLKVAGDLNLANDPNFTGGRRPVVDFNLNDPNVRDSILAGMQGAISVASIPKTDIIRISCRTLSAQLSADIVNRLVKAYRARSLNTSADAAKNVSDFLKEQLDDLRGQVENSQKRVINLQNKLGVLGFDPTHNQITSNLDDLTKAATQSQLQRILAEVRYRILTGMDRNLLDESVDAQRGGTLPSQLPTLRTQLDSDKAQLAGLSSDLGPNHPRRKALEAQVASLNKSITDEQNRVIAQASGNLLAAQTEEKQTRNALETQKSDADKLRDDLVLLTIAQREFDSSRTLYEGLVQRLRTAEVQAGLDSTEIDIVDPAMPPVNPNLKSRSSILMINTVIMLIVGLIVAFILDSLDTGLRSVAEIEGVSGLPSLALIPRTRRISNDTANLSPVQRNLGVIASPKSQFSEAFRALRTSLLLSTAGHEPRIILLTSATPSEGKTTVSINLAGVLAQREVRVLLIDADLRRPTVHHRFGLNGKVGLTSVLTGSVSLADAVQKVAELPFLDVLVSGPVPPFPTELLGSSAMRHLIEDAKGTYTHIVMDSPPLLSVTDSVVLARDADAVVMIVRHGKSSKHAVRRARDLLVRSGAPVTGIVLNAVDLNSPEYYSYYGYYGYAGYASQGVDSAGWDPKADRPKPPEGSQR